MQVKNGLVSKGQANLFKKSQRAGEKKDGVFAVFFIVTASAVSASIP
ncbi:MAG: hypothetical protein H7244_06700 [Herminiimonas sp.]|nr:hypothetical protein [Herminiimonas sp.]